MADPLPGNILEGIPMKGSLKEITVVESTEEDGRVQSWGKDYVREYDPVQLRLIQDPHKTAHAEHAGRVKSFDLLDGQY